MASIHKIILISLLTFVTSISKAQNTGFFGKKTFIGADTRLYIPLWYNFAQGVNDSKYKVNGDQLKPAKNLLTYGFNVSLGRTLERKSSFILQVGVLNFKTYNQSNYTPNFETILMSSFILGRSISIMPILEFCGRDGLAPLGLSHQIGLGFVNSRILEKDYMVIAQSSTLSKFTNENTDFFNYEQKLKSYSFMYKLNLRIPVSRRLLYNIGMRYNINFTPSTYYTGTESTDKFFTNSEMKEMLRTAHGNNLISIETGFNFMLF